MKTIGTFKELDLGDLEDWVWGNEVGYGPITVIGDNGAATVASFNYSLTDPTSRATIRPLAAGVAIPPQGMKEVCRGEVFIASQLQKVGVYR